MLGLYAEKLEVGHGSFGVGQQVHWICDLHAGCWSQADVEAVVEMYTAEREEALLAGRPDYVIDAIDNIDTKVGWGGMPHPFVHVFGAWRTRRSSCASAVARKAAPGQSQ